MATVTSILVTLGQFYLLKTINAVNSDVTCKVWGDPHFTTFDGNIYHFQGEGYFDYIKECDREDNDGWDVPIIVSGKHEYCGEHVTCITEVLVQIKHFDENDGSTKFNFISYNVGGLNPIFKYHQSSAIGIHTFNGKNGIITANVNHNYFKITFTTGSNKQTYIDFNYKGTTLILNTPSTFENDALTTDMVCGLCGTLTYNKNDDFTKCNTNEILEVKYSNVEEFGESCCRKDLDNAFIGKTDCNPYLIPSPKPTNSPTEGIICTDISEDICINAYYTLCPQCSTSNIEISEEYLEGCSIDLCSVTKCKEYILNTDKNDISIDKLKELGCFDTSISFCEVNCPIPTLEPTIEPTLTPTVEDLCTEENILKLQEANKFGFYEWYHTQYKDSFYRHDTTRPGGNYWQYKGKKATIWAEEIEGLTVPLHVYYKSLSTQGLVDHFYTTNIASYNGYKYQGSWGYVMKTPCPGFNYPLYQYFAGAGVLDHWYSLSNGGRSGYKYQGIAGYVLPINYQDNGVDTV